MKSTKKLIGSLLLLLCGSVPAYATDLLTVYQQALQNDPTLLKAQATREANREGVPISRSALFPQLTASANTTSVHSNEQTPSPVTNIRPATSVNQHDYQLNLTQPLFNLQDWMALQAAHATANQANAIYESALQGLIVRVAGAYFNVLQAQDILRYTTAQKTATANQLKQIKEKYQVGLATMTDVYQAQAAYDKLVAQEINDQNNVTNALQALQQITGVDYATLDPLGKQLPLVTPQPENVTSWVHAAEKYNWDLLADRYAAQSAKATVHQNFAGHFPTVDAVGSYQNGNDLGQGTSQQTQWQSQVGVQVNLPLFQGGLVTAQTHQAQDFYVAASDQLEITHRQVLFDTQQAFNNVMAGISQIQADRVAVTSAKSALDSTNAGYQAGTKTILDVLTALQNLYQAQSDLATDQYAYINNTLRLKQAAGSLSGADVVAINYWLQRLMVKTSS